MWKLSYLSISNIRYVIRSSSFKIQSWFVSLPSLQMKTKATYLLRGFNQYYVFNVMCIRIILFITWNFVPLASWLFELLVTRLWDDMTIGWPFRAMSMCPSGTKSGQWRVLVHFDVRKGAVINYRRQKSRIYKRKYSSARHNFASCCKMYMYGSVSTSRH